MLPWVASCHCFISVMGCWQQQWKKDFASRLMIPSVSLLGHSSWCSIGVHGIFSCMLEFTGFCHVLVASLPISGIVFWFVYSPFTCYGAGLDHFHSTSSHIYLWMTLPWFEPWGADASDREEQLQRRRGLGGSNERSTGLYGLVREDSWGLCPSEYQLWCQSTRDPTVGCVQHALIFGLVVGMIIS